MKNSSFFRLISSLPLLAAVKRLGNGAYKAVLAGSGLCLLPLLLLAFISACGSNIPPTPIPPSATAVAAPTATSVPISNAPARSQANVESIQVMMLESFPVQVNVVARGELPDGCTTIADKVVQQRGTTFQVIITTFRQPDALCTQALVPFEETVSLNVAELAAGTYDVLVNEISGSFTLDVDNTLATDEPTPEATAVPTAGTINGRVVHDLCETSNDPVVEGTQAAAGCIASPAATGQIFVANGRLEANEPGIAGVTISLGADACPVTVPMATAVTDASGAFSFSDLAAGSYCVAIDVTSAANSTPLDAGIWTVPTGGTAQAAITVAAGETASADFGWDFTFLPAPAVDLANCANDASFVSDLTVPDDTQFTPLTEFEVGWRLRNTGTCPWSEEYTLIFVNGTPLGVENAPMPQVVAPGQTVDVSITMTAPDKLGTYRSNWQVADASGAPFGVAGFLENSFWVQIVVAEEETSVATPAPGSGSIGGLAWRDLCTRNGSPASICVQIGESSGVFRADGTYQGIERPLVSLTVTLAQNACPDTVPVSPAEIVATTQTSDDGTYVFTGLDEGTYCIYVDAFASENLNLLIPGDFTWPATGVNKYTFFLDPGEQEERIDFGWDDADD